MGSLTLLRTVLMAIFFFWGVFVFCKLPLNCNKFKVWSPHQANLSDMVEVVQRRETKLMVGNRIPYKERLNKTGLM